MNYEENNINWKIGDVVIHDADKKERHMLMKIIKIVQDENNTLYHTRYLIVGNHTDQKKVWINYKKFLHDPKRFDLKCAW